MSSLKHTRFMISCPIPSGKGEMQALFQTMTRGLVILSGISRADAVDRVMTSDDVYTRKLLAEQGFLIEEETDETILFNSWFQQYVHDTETLRSRVLVTRRCNLRCRYCIIEPETKDMTSETALAVDRYFMDLIRQRRPLRVRDNYLGGEPLLNLPVILESATRRFYFCKGRGVDYEFNITTNGMLLKPEAIRALKNAGMTGVRLSLAGPEELHDSLRMTSTDGKTYGRIMANVRDIAGMIPISIECQYDAGEEGYRKIPELMETLIDKGIHMKGFAFTPILERRSHNQFNAGMGAPEIALFLKKEAARRGIPMYDDPPSSGCMADMRSYFIFDTDGTIIPCPSLQGGELAYGHVNTGIDFVAEARIRHRNLPEKCLTQCEILPVCLGGCRLQALTHGDTFNDVDCHYDMWRDMLTDYIKVKAEEGLKGNIGVDEDECLKCAKTIERPKVR